MSLDWAKVLDALFDDPTDSVLRKWAEDAIAEGRGTPGQLYAYGILAQKESVFTLLADFPGQVKSILLELPAPGHSHAPGPGEWSARQIVHHLADNEAVNAVRIRSVLTEAEPEIFGYDSDHWTRFFDIETTDEALRRFEVQRVNTVRLLESLSARDLDRRGVLSYRGAESIRVLAAVLAGHDQAHLDQLGDALRAFDDRTADELP